MGSSSSYAVVVAAAAVFCHTACVALEPQAPRQRPRLYFSKLFEAHTVPSWHPESAERATLACRGVMDVCDDVELREVSRLHPDLTDALNAVHDPEYLRELAVPMGPKDVIGLDQDTFISRASWNVTRLATSAWLEAVDAALADPSPCDFAVTRPPGHHAGRSSAMGFGTLNMCAAAAFHALSKGKTRVAVLDIDVHLGNGVASIFGDSEEEGLRYCSLHQHPCFPGSGGDASLFGPPHVIKFLPQPPGTNSEEWLRSLRGEALPWLAEMDPELLIVSAGFDALETDHLAQLNLIPEDFYEAARAIKATFPDVPLVAGLEGGYDLEAMPLALARFIQGAADGSRQLR